MGGQIRCRGIIKEVQRGGQFIVALQDMPEHIVRTYLSGKMKINKITLTIGDPVDIILSEYDLTRGRIVYRYTP